MKETYAAVAWVLKELGYSKDDILSAKKNARFVVQKVVFLMKFLGVEAFKELNFNLYIKGPYSKELADIYYLMARKLPPEEMERLAKEYDIRVPGSIRAKVWYFKSRPQWWMEIAATILMIVDRYREKVDDITLYKLVRSAKPWIDKERFDKILSALRRKGILH